MQSPAVISVEKLKEFMNEAFDKVGVPDDDREIIVDVLISSDLRGIESHGIGRLKMYIDRIRDGILNPVTQFEVLRDYPGTALIDGHDGMGHVIAFKAMQLAIDKARKTGVSAVAVRNSSHFGIAGYYSLMAVKEDMAGYAFTNARPSISPTFGRDPMMGTNPIAFAVPTDEENPFCLDMATSISQRGKIEVAEREGKNLPKGWAIDKQGHFVTDPSLLLQLFAKKGASLLPLGGAGEDLAGYKGYGLAMMVEILSSIFSGGPFGWGLTGFDENGKKTPHSLGHFFIAINISFFMDLEEFKKSCGDLMRSMRNSGRLDPEQRIYTAGEKENENIPRISKEGVPLNETLVENMQQLKQELEMEISLPF